MTKATFRMSIRETQEWRRAVEPHFQGTTDMGWARLMSSRNALPREVKSLAGYLGQFKRGERRGLVHILGTPAWHDALVKAMGGNVDFTATLDLVKDGQASDAPMVLAGFEDFRSFPYESLFETPPLWSHATQSAISGEELLKTVLDDKPGALTLRGRPGAGATTLLRWIARQAQARGYVTEWLQTDGQLPVARSALVLIDADVLVDQGELYKWTLTGDRRVVAARHAGAALGGPQGLKWSMVRILPVTIDWLNGLVERLRDESVRARRLLPRQVTKRSALAQAFVVQSPMGPEEATVWLRARIDNTLGSETMIRQFVGRRAGAVNVKPVAIDRRMLVRLNRAYVYGQTCEEALADRLLARVREVIERTSLNPSEQSMLTAALPEADPTGTQRALRKLHLVRIEGTHWRPRLRALVAPDVAHAILREEWPKALWVGDHTELLGALLSTPEGRERVASEAQSLEPLVWLAAVPSLMPIAERIQWTQELLVRWLAAEFVLGLVEAPPRPGMHFEPFTRRVSTPWAPLCAVPAIEVPLDGLRREVEKLRSALGIDEKVEDRTLRFVRAIRVPMVAHLLHHDVWASGAEAAISPDPWLRVVSGSEREVEILLDFDAGLGADWLTREHYASPIMIDAAKRWAHSQPAEFAAWFGGACRMCIDAPTRESASRLRFLESVIVERPAKVALRQADGELRSGLMGWEALIDKPSGRLAESVSKLIRHAWSPDERDEQLVRNGQVSLGWPLMMRWRLVSDKAAIRLLAAVQAGEVSVDSWLETRNKGNVDDAADFVAAFLHTIVPGASSNHLFEVARMVGLERVVDCVLAEPSVMGPGAREFLWRQHRDLGNQDVFWRLFDPFRFDTTSEACRIVDKRCANKAMGMAETAHPKRWGQLLEIGLEVEAADYALLAILRAGPHPVNERGLIVLCDVLRKLQERFSVEVDAWLEDALRDHHNVVDTTALREVWSHSSVRLAPLADWLKEPRDGERGKGVLGRFHAEEVIVPWLDYPPTCDAMLDVLAHAMSLTQLADMVAARVVIPGPKILTYLRRAGLLEALLQEASAWPNDELKALCLAVARVTTRQGRLAAVARAVVF
jgi:hypothetical protein